MWFASLGTTMALVLTASGASARPLILPPSSIKVYQIAGSPNAPRIRAWDGFNRADGAVGAARG